MTTVLLAVVAGTVIGLSLGALGGGGSILAVPVLVYALDQSPVQATTGSLVVVGVTALLGGFAAHRAGNVLPARGLAFGAIAVAGAVVGARLAGHVSEPVLLASFSVLMLLVGALMVWRTVRSARGPERRTVRRGSDAPIIAFRPRFTCRCLPALEVVGAATAVGMLTGFLGVGGGFLIVPALVLVLGLPMDLAAGTSLVVIAITSTVALIVRAGAGATPDWGIVLLLTAVSSVAAVGGARLAARTDTRRLGIAFTGLVVAVAIATASQALPALV